MIQQLTKEAIAKAFSKGNFEMTYPYLSDDIEWNVIGDEIVRGRENVINKCKQTRRYFDSITTQFLVSNVIQLDNHVFITGTGVFINKKERTQIDACDLYFFDDAGKLETIASYCVPIAP